MSTEAVPDYMLAAFSGGFYAFFFDVDGTLAELQLNPDDVTIPPAVLKNLQQLSDVSQGALALVSGRPLSQLDKLVAPLTLPLAGVHGAERREGNGRLHRVLMAPQVAEPLQEILTQGMQAMPGTLMEIKGMAFALHYRQAPQWQEQVQRLAEQAVARFPTLVLQPGKCVVEIKPAGIDKGAAIRAFMQEPPFSGRIPVFIGDDLTDEKGFAAVNEMGGVSVRVGEGSGEARHQLDTVSDVHRLLEQLLLQLQQDYVGEEPRL